MRPIDFRLNGVSAEWTGGPNASESVIKVNGTEVARNIFTNPLFDSNGDLSLIRARWEHKDISFVNNEIKLSAIADAPPRRGAGLDFFGNRDVTPDKLALPEAQKFPVKPGSTLHASVDCLWSMDVRSELDCRFHDGESFTSSIVYLFDGPRNVEADTWHTFKGSVLVPEGSKYVLISFRDMKLNEWLKDSYIAFRNPLFSMETPYFFSGDSTTEQLMQSPTIGSPLEGSLEDIAGPLVAELTSYGTVDAPLDPLSSRTLVCVTKDRSTMSSYYPFCNNGIDWANGRIDLRTQDNSAILGTRFDSVGGSANGTSSLPSSGSKPIVFGVILNENISDDKSYVQLFDCNGLGDPRYVNFGNGITDQIFFKNDYAIWAGLWPKALTEDEIAKVTLWLKQRYL